MATAYSKALDYLTGRSRTVKETEDYLLRKGFSTRDTKQALARLLAHGYLDDSKTAAGWVEYTMRCKPRGRERVRRELRARGIEQEIAEQALIPLDDQTEQELALRLLAPRPVKSWTQDKLFRFLRYRGFSYQTIERIRLHYEEGSNC